MPSALNAARRRERGREVASRQHPAQHAVRVVSQALVGGRAHQAGLSRQQGAALVLVEGLLERRLGEEQLRDGGEPRLLRLTRGRADIVMTSVCAAQHLASGRFTFESASASVASGATTMAWRRVSSGRPLRGSIT